MSDKEWVIGASIDEIQKNENEFQAQDPFGKVWNDLKNTLV